MIPDGAGPPATEIELRGVFFIRKYAEAAAGGGALLCCSGAISW